MTSKQLINFYRRGRIKRRWTEPVTVTLRIFQLVTWIRQKEPASIPDEETVPFELLRSIPVSYRSPEERKKDTTDEFKKIDQLLPKKKTQLPEERAREIEADFETSISPRLKEKSRGQREGGGRHFDLVSCRQAN